MRYLTPYITEDLLSKMVFVNDPKPVGKTTLAKDILADHFSSSSGPLAGKTVVTVTP